MQPKIYKYLLLLILPLLFSSLYSCKKYLEAKPDKAIAIPSTLEDLQALLDNGAKMTNGPYPGVLEIPTDDYWLSFTNWSARTDIEQKTYVWDRDALPAVALNYWWALSYTTIFYANVVLDEISRFKITDDNKANNIKGSALFYRGFCHHNFAQLYCKPYTYGGDNTGPGIPLRLTPSFNEISARGTVEKTYNQIVSDLKEAARLLPIHPVAKTRPSRPAAFAALARVYLSMEDYLQAGKYADSCLQLYSTLIDYNTINASAARPFVRFNAETIFFSYSNGNSMLNPSRANVDSNLYKSYADKDLRKGVFFQSNGNKDYGFKGSYSGGGSGTYFNGFATDEILLIRAECHARNGNKAAALADLNSLLSKRWVVGTYVPYIDGTDDQVLRLILTERRKELIMRGIRWSDLRRLNKDPRFAITIKRVFVNGNDTTIYTLPPNDLRYVLLIPADVIALTGMQQNPR